MQQKFVLVVVDGVGVYVCVCVVQRTPYPYIYSVGHLRRCGANCVCVCLCVCLPPVGCVTRSQKSFQYFIETKFAMALREMDGCRAVLEA